MPSIRDPASASQSAKKKNDNIIKPPPSPNNIEPTITDDGVENINKRYQVPPQASHVTDGAIGQITREFNSRLNKLESNSKAANLKMEKKVGEIEAKLANIEENLVENISQLHKIETKQDDMDSTLRDIYNIVGSLKHFQLDLEASESAA